jgi:hypothetical protein
MLHLLTQAAETSRYQAEDDGELPSLGQYQSGVSENDEDDVVTPKEPNDISKCTRKILTPKRKSNPLGDSTNNSPIMIEIYLIKNEENPLV